MVTNEQILTTALFRVNTIYSCVKNIFEENKDAFLGNKELVHSFNTFFQVAKLTMSRLENPVLSIAMVGTTGAGKSTVTNALVGRCVAPMEKKEMSAGILTLTDSPRNSITVHPTSAAMWSSGTTMDLSDSEICGRIRGIYEKYHRHGAKIAPPVIDVTGSIEWQRNRAILELPSNLNVEFIDLPGLKALNDYKNLEVIQKILSKAFCIVLMDFNDVDPSRINRLLEEVKDVVKAANNNTEFLLFVLNKVDDVKSDQITVCEKISELRGLIKETLALDSEKEILPFVGQLYYLIQMAVKKDPNSFEIIGFYPDKIQNIFTDCSNFFRQAKKSKVLSKDEFMVIRRIEDCLDEGEELQIFDVKEFYSICCRISEANSLFAEIKRRINESFEHIVIRPTLDAFNKVLIKILDEIDVYISISKNDSVCDLISKKIGIINSRIFVEGCNDSELASKFTLEIERIETVLEDLETSSTDENILYLISRIKKDIRKVRETISFERKGYIDSEVDSINFSINEIAEHLDTLKSSEEIVSYLKSQKENRVISVFNGMTDVPENVKKKLVSVYLDGFRASLSSGKKVGEFIENMSPKIPSGLLDEFSMPYKWLYELFYDRFSSFIKEGETYTKKTDVPYDEQWKNMVMKDFREADRRVRDVLSKQTGLDFQKEAHAILGAMQIYLSKELEKILVVLKDNANIHDGDISMLMKNNIEVAEVPIVLPEELFTFSSPYSSDNKEAKIAGSKFVGYRHTSWCSSDIPIYESVYKDEYTYKFDNEVGCYNRWVRGIGSAEMVFWSIINKWLKDQVANYMNTIKEKVKEVLSMVDSLLDARHEELESNQEKCLEKLNDLSATVVMLRKQREELNSF